METIATPPASHVGFGTTSTKKPWDGTPGVKKIKVPRVFTYHEKPDNNVHLLKSVIKMMAFGASELRRAEMKTRSFYKSASLRETRIGPARRNARVANLAYAFMRGRTYRNCENSTITLGDADDRHDLAFEVAEAVMTYGGQKFEDIRTEDIEKWFNIGLPLEVDVNDEKIGEVFTD